MLLHDDERGMLMFDLVKGSRPATKGTETCTFCEGVGDRKEL